MLIWTGTATWALHQALTAATTFRQPLRAIRSAMNNCTDPALNRRAISFPAAARPPSAPAADALEAIIRSSALVSAADWAILRREHPVAKVDLLRLIVMYEQGGLYSDVDRLFNKDLDPYH